MKINKIINNNIVSCIDYDGKEIIVMGRGIGFGTRIGNFVKKEKIEKVFKIDNEISLNKFKDILLKLPLEHIKISADIIIYAKKLLNRKLNQNIYITLTDHINFAIERFKNNIKFENPILNEIQMFYKEEYIVGEYAINIIKNKLGLDLSSSEAGFIALHIVNAEYTNNINDIMSITNLIQNAIIIVKNYFQIDVDESSLDYQRFVTHLRFLAQRIISNKMLNNQNDDFNKIISTMYPKEYQCSIEIKNYIKNNYNKNVTDEEIVYLAVHIKRLVM